MARARKLSYPYMTSIVGGGMLRVHPDLRYVELLAFMQVLVLSLYVLARTERRRRPKGLAYVKTKKTAHDPKLPSMTREYWMRQLIQKTGLSRKVCHAGLSAFEREILSPSIGKGRVEYPDVVIDGLGRVSVTEDPNRWHITLA